MGLENGASWRQVMVMGHQILEIFSHENEAPQEAWLSSNKGISSWSPTRNESNWESCL